MNLIIYLSSRRASTKYYTLNSTRNYYVYFTNKNHIIGIFVGYYNYYCFRYHAYSFNWLRFDNCYDYQNNCWPHNDFGRIILTGD